MRFRQAISFGTIFLARIVGAGSLFAINWLIVRYLGLDALAKFAIFVSLVSILATVASRGFPAIAPIFVAEYVAKDQPELFRGFVQTAVRQSGVLLTLFAVGSAVIYAGFPNGFHNLPVWMAPALLASAGATALLGLNGAVLVGMKKQVAGLLPDTLVRPTLFLLLSFFFLSSGIVVDVSGILWLLTLSLWLTLGFVLVRDRRLHQDLRSAHLKTDEAKWKKASLPWMGISLLWDFMIDVVLLLTSLLAGSVEIAILHICFRYRVLAGFGMRTIHMLMMPEIAGGAATGNKKEVVRKLSQLNIASLVYSIAVMTGFAILGDWLLGIFSINISIGMPVLLIVSATMIIRSLFGPAPLILAIHQLHTATLWVSLVGLLVAIAFVISTFGTLGILAAAIGYTGANLIISAVLWYVAMKKTGIDCSILSGIAPTSGRWRLPSMPRLAVSGAPRLKKSQKS
ncbi:MAG: hypothetical protein QNJ29_04580 [Rhizobiaceae bacterium]|nr:hypothetical protein [Rhizobiaceae bacterium]